MRRFMKSSLMFCLGLVSLVGSVGAIEGRPPALAHPECDEDPSQCASIWVYGTVGIAPQLDNDPIPTLPCETPDGSPCTVEVEEDPTPIPGPVPEPTMPPDDPFEQPGEWEEPEDNTTPVPVTCEQWVEAQRGIEGWATWSYVNWNFYHGNPHGTEPDDGGWTTGFNVEPEWNDPPPSCDAVDMNAFMWQDGVVKDDIYVHCEFARVTLHPEGGWPPKYYYGITLAECAPAYRQTLDNDPVPCTLPDGSPCGVEVEEPTPVPNPYPYDDPTQVPSDPYEEGGDHDPIEDDTTPVPLSCTSWAYTIAGASVDVFGCSSLGFGCNVDPIDVDVPTACDSYDITWYASGTDGAKIGDGEYVCSGSKQRDYATRFWFSGNNINIELTGCESAQKEPDPGQTLPCTTPDGSPCTVEVEEDPTPIPAPVPEPTMPPEDPFEQPGEWDNEDPSDTAEMMACILAWDSMSTTTGVITSVVSGYGLSFDSVDLYQCEGLELPVSHSYDAFMVYDRFRVGQTVACTGSNVRSDIAVYVEWDYCGIVR